MNFEATVNIPLWHHLHISHVNGALPSRYLSVDQSSPPHVQWRHMENVVVLDIYSLLDVVIVARCLFPCTSRLDGCWTGWRSWWKVSCLGGANVVLGSLFMSWMPPIVLHIEGATASLLHYLPDRKNCTTDVMTRAPGDLLALIVPVQFQMVVVTNGGSDKANTLVVMPRITRMRCWATQAC